MSLDHLQLSGNFPAVPTPFLDSGEVDFDHLRHNIKKLNQLPLDGYVIGGSNGEFAYLSVEERVLVVKKVRGWLPHDRILIAGAGMESTKATIDLTKSMAEAGAHAALVVTPHYFTGKMTAEALEKHYLSVADVSPLPILLYSVPANTGLILPAEAVLRLAPHPNIVGMKDSGGDITRIGYLVEYTPDDFAIFAGSAGFYLAALVIGAVGLVGALANIAAPDLARMVDAFRTGELEIAREIQLRLIAPNYAVTSRYGVAGLKAAMDMLGFYGGPVRSPLLPLTDEEMSELRRILEEGQLL
jgi:4-hydroxy-2-oxoglutarate aldolase